MSQYNLNFNKLCHNLKLGEIVGEPEALSGGLLHRMYAIQTTQGKYAVKALNPQIMSRPTAMQNFIRSEQIANIAANTLPALPAKIFEGTSMQEIDNQFYLVFDWVDGESLKPNRIKTLHCEKIGEFLAELHMTDFSKLGKVNDWINTAELIDWDYYLQIGKENDAMWVNLLLESMDQLYNWNAQANESARLLASDMVISHGDLESKNVLWHLESPTIIDWESAGYINPMHDLTETAIYWSRNDKGILEKERFIAFIVGYKKKCGALQANWRMVLTNGFLGKLGWLEYSLKRSLWIECTDKVEQEIGTAQVTGTIKDISHYANVISELENWLNEV